MDRADTSDANSTLLPVRRVDVDEGTQLVGALSPVDLDRSPTLSNAELVTFFCFCRRSSDEFVPRTVQCSEEGSLRASLTVSLDILIIDNNTMQDNVLFRE